MRKEEGDSEDAYSSLSRTTPFALCKVGGWYSKDKRGDRRSKTIPGFRSWTFFHTQYGMPSGLWADEGKDLQSVWAISSFVRRSVGGAKGGSVRAGGLSGGRSGLAIPCECILGRRPRQVGEGGCFLGGNQFVGCLYIFGGVLCEYVRPFCRLCFFDGLEIA